MERLGRPATAFNRLAPTALGPRLASACAALVALCLAGGCATPPGFPGPRVTHNLNGQTVRAFDTNNDQRDDYWEFQNAAGRTSAIAYATGPAGQQGLHIDLDEIPAADCPHLVIVLDGVPFELVDELYRAGRFRLFHPPTRVICCFPAMTDLALADLFHAGRCIAFQSLYFDREKNRLSDSSDVYLTGRNSPWLAKMSYRASLWWDTLVYLDPQTVFNHELAAIARLFLQNAAGQSNTREVCTYSVGSAGLGTRGGREAILKYLETVDQLCERVVFEHRGRVKLTLTADHGHNLVENRLISFDDTLKAGGYRPASAIHDSRDVVAIAYGLVTYVEFFTRDAPGVARCLLRHPDIEFACYPDGDALAIVTADGHATIRPTPTGLAYDDTTGDPLNLGPVLAELRAAGKVGPDGTIDEPALFAATVESDYPDPLARLWRAFHGLVDSPPDLIVNLRDGACHGSRFFHTMIGHVASTHGSLNRRNSTTFVLTMLGDLPPAMPTADVWPAIDRLREPPVRPE